ncbi:sulfotransferase family protein [Streptosporangium sp. DT93]|uniref:sulfotransferase family protein n=1 Tax=Streptosporangium sp. DT93 TaxID=3393428 RepID=UPI003CE7FB00
MTLTDPAPPAVPGVLVVNSGRCGSTLLSRLLGGHEDVLSLSEYMISLGSLAYTAPGPLTGAQFWDIISGPSAIEELLNRLDLHPPEITYRGPIRACRDGRTAMPRFLGAALPGLTADPDALFGELALQVPAFPTQTLAAHHRWLFGLLAARFGRRIWVERSGANSFYADRLVEMFPDVRVVHLRRDCLPAVLSMRAHPYFQLATIGEQFVRLCALNPFDEDAPHYQDGIPENLRSMLPQHLTADLLRRRGELLEPFVLAWVAQNMYAQALLARLPQHQTAVIDYGTLLEAPATELTRLGRFLGLTDPEGWAARSASEVRKPADRSTLDLARKVEQLKEKITATLQATGRYQPVTIA